MRFVFFIICLLVGAHGYNISAILEALSANYNVETGSFSLFNVSSCEDSPSCFGNNPESPYVSYTFPSWNGQNFGHFQVDQAVLVINAKPPSCRYFGFTPYLFTRSKGFTPTILYASLSDTLNMNTVNVSQDGTITFVSSPNPNVTSHIQNILASYLQPQSINSLPLPGQLLNLGTSVTADTISYLARYALFTNSTQGQLYLNNIPGYVFKITPKNPDTSVLFPYPIYRPYGPPSKNETYLQGALDQLVSAIRASEPGTPLVQQGVDVLNSAGYVNGFTCINSSKNCNGDNRDARYIGSMGLYISNTSSSHTWVVGVQHQTTGKAVYTGVAASYQDKMLGVVSVADTKMKGSAEQFIPTHQYASNLYAIKFARSCNSTELFCFTVPVNFPGVPLNETVSFVERVYVEPTYNVAPASGSTLPPTFIRYRSLVPQ